MIKEGRNSRKGKTDDNKRGRKLENEMEEKEEEEAFKGIEERKRR